ncbi:hypothetical protein PHYBLDRAFT_139229 [Phycomyces blakesleeanus NRRL 1555(-)]|uniref:Uncharacterized protein n=1 Tax=Phycomyces blakesleeanus (strain ATCC 8743b / DSM 1359 / FGSC 10004 / NBRC 33097 / NRRL 1555) TaxID=763407 RepID=A0A162V0H4_PHYB8|nr:hypothetical protein PHYBLDRAFT_139229 [Phycomyces blakesleeanus NRRL 1555(-)]OAD79193.1 hypothetical protein PHYBLDRAFT_139229 [Phycomyces blakesleeanus NRRL 1555(-)]|eukprot:XP_018297233.1 hypothetical protein PHYBLDRAFT_139229 [Phycomyces blakesleeanus NRRL 1555(-)]
MQDCSHGGQFQIYHIAQKNRLHHLGTKVLMDTVDQLVARECSIRLKVFILVFGDRFGQALPVTSGAGRS